MSKSADSAEREVEKSREKLTRALDQLQSHFSRLDPTTDVKNYAFGADIFRDTYQNITLSFRRDPIPLLMIGAGVGWLIYETIMRTAKNNGRQPLSPGRAAKGMAAPSRGSSENLYRTGED